MFMFTSINIYRINKVEFTEFNDIHITHLGVVYDLNACLSFEMAKTYILKLIIAYMSICGPGQLGRYSGLLRTGRSVYRIPLSARLSTRPGWPWGPLSLP